MHSSNERHCCSPFSVNKEKKKALKKLATWKTFASSFVFFSSEAKTAAKKSKTKGKREEKQKGKDREKQDAYSLRNGM